MFPSVKHTPVPRPPVGAAELKPLQEPCSSQDPSRSVRPSVLPLAGYLLWCRHGWGGAGMDSIVRRLTSARWDVHTSRCGVTHPSPARVCLRPPRLVSFPSLPFLPPNYHFKMSCATGRSGKLRNKRRSINRDYVRNKKEVMDQG